MIESLTSGEIKALRNKLKEIDEILIKGERQVNNSFLKNQNDVRNYKFNQKIEPEKYYHFIYEKKEIWIEYAGRKDENSFYQLVEVNREKGEKTSKQILKGKDLIWTREQWKMRIRAFLDRELMEIW